MADFESLLGGSTKSKRVESAVVFLQREPCFAFVLLPADPSALPFPGLNLPTTIRSGIRLSFSEPYSQSSASLYKS